MSLSPLQKKHRKKALGKMRAGVPQAWVPGSTRFERRAKKIEEAAPPTCHCGTVMVKRASKFHHALDQRIHYRCPASGCNTNISAHPDGRPMGIPANQETRDARTAAHHAFDAIWKSGVVTRDVAYAWLRRRLHVEHIGHATLEACEDIVAACKVVTPAELRGVHKEVVRAERISRPRISVDEEMDSSDSDDGRLP